MIDADNEARHGLDLECDLDAPPEKVWRAISIPEFRNRWLPEAALADPEATAVDPGRAISYRMCDEAPPHLESTVTFAIGPNDAGGTRLRIVHSFARVHAAANDNALRLTLAA